MAISWQTWRGMAACIFLLATGCAGKGGIAKNAENRVVPEIHPDSGIPLLDVPGREHVFNGKMNLGTAGYGLRCFNVLKSPEPIVTAPLKATKDENGECCLLIPSSPGRVGWTLMARELYLLGNSEYEISFQARKNNVAGRSEVNTFSLWLRHPYPINEWEAGETVNHSTNATLTEKWQGYSLNVKTLPEDSYFWVKFDVRSQDFSRPLPDIYIADFKVKKLGDESTEKGSDQVAIFTDRKTATYEHGETVTFTLMASLPECTGTQAKLDLDLVDDVTFAIIGTHEAVLAKNKDGIFEGTLSFKAQRYGSFSTQARMNGKTINRWGGWVSVIHPPQKAAADSLSRYIGYNGRSSGSTKRWRFQNADDHTTIIDSFSSDENDYFHVLRSAGIKMAREWVSWRDLEPQPDQFNYLYADYKVAGNRRYGMDTVIIPGPQFIYDPKDNSPKVHSSPLPPWLHERSKTTEKTSEQDGLLPPIGEWEKFCRALMERYRGNVAYWEILNEPEFKMTPEAYMPYLQAAYQVAETIEPRPQIIGAGPTGDRANADFGWMADLVRLGAEKHMDGMAYHPYGVGNDYQPRKNEYFKASELIRKLRAIQVDKSKPLFNTECFYLSDFLGKRTKSRWTADAGLRHYIITIAHGIRCLAFESSLLFRDSLNPHVCPSTPRIYGNPFPAPVVPALNHLSWMLRDKTTAEALKINNFVNAYLFAGSNPVEAVAVCWVLHPKGGEWNAATAPDGLTFADMWGNPLAFGNGMKLGLHPVYIAGTPDKITAFLKTSFFKIEQPLKLFGRMFQDRMYVEGINASGCAARFEVALTPTPGLSLPESILFDFSDGTGCDLIQLKGEVGKNFSSAAKIPWQAFVKGQTAGEGNLQMLPVGNAYDLPPDEASALSLSMNGGSRARMWCDPEHLHAEVAVEDREIIAAKGNNLWEGDALEVFIDPAPFRRMDSDATTNMNVYQYVFAAVPAANASTVVVIRRKQSSAASTQTEAVSKIVKTAAGYVLTASIPWHEIKLESIVGDVFGIDLEVNHMSNSGGKKEHLGKHAEPSWCKRLHYPLFKLPESVFNQYVRNAINTIGGEMVRNPDFSIHPYGDPEGWSYQVQGDTQIIAGKDYGLNGGGLMIAVPKAMPQPAIVTQTIQLQPGKNRKATMQAMIKIDDVRNVGKPDAQSMSGLCLGADFHDGKANQYIGRNSYGASVVGSHGWTRYQFSMEIPDGATALQLSAGLDRNTTGKMMIDNISLTYTQKASHEKGAGP